MKSLRLIIGVALASAAIWHLHGATAHAQTLAPVPAEVDEEGADAAGSDAGDTFAPGTPEPADAETADTEPADTEAADGEPAIGEAADGEAADGGQADGGEEGMQVLARGPVHEAFADPVTFSPRESEVVPKAPPEPIQEQPPEVKPDGDAIWISGYWAWDDERKDFLWVSGAWRVPPGGQRWVPGYWAQAGGGYKWVAGFWTGEEAQEVNYLPQPPQTQERGPNAPSPGDDYFWVPGNWSYQTTGYAWTPGYWTGVQPNWVWMPARYYWTPSGYVFVRGYWDYPIVSRGWLFAPVYFAPGYYERPGFFYRPAAVINVNALSVQLFVRPRWGCYYFGDYYGPAYAGIGFYPWFRWGGVGIGYDPIFTYQRWYHHHRGDEHWERHIHDTFAQRQNNPALRPAHLMNAGGHNVAAHERLAMPVNQFIAQKHVQDHVQHLNSSQRQQFTQSAESLRKFQGQRQQTEVKHASTSAGAERLKGGLGQDHATLKLPNANPAGGARAKLGVPGGSQAGGIPGGRPTAGSFNGGAGASGRLGGSNANINSNAGRVGGVQSGGGAQSFDSGRNQLGPGTNRVQRFTPGGNSPNSPNLGGQSVLQGGPRNGVGGQGVIQGGSGKGGPPANRVGPPAGGPPPAKGGPANRIERSNRARGGGGEGGGHRAASEPSMLPGTARSLERASQTPAPFRAGPQGGADAVRRETLRPTAPATSGGGVRGGAPVGGGAAGFGAGGGRPGGGAAGSGAAGSGAAGGGGAGGFGAGGGAAAGGRPAGGNPLDARDHNRERNR